MTDRGNLEPGLRSGDENSSEADPIASDSSPAVEVSQQQQHDGSDHPDEQPVVRSDQNEMVVVDEDDLPGATGDLDAPGDLDPQFVTGTLDGFVGTDGPATFTLLETGSASGYTYKAENDGQVLTISDATKPVLEISLTDAATGKYRVELLDKVDHNNGPAPKFETNLDFRVEYRVSDADKDYTPGHFTIRVNDDILVSEELLSEELTFKTSDKVDHSLVSKTVEASETTPIIIAANTPIVGILTEGENLYIQLSDGSLIEVTGGLKTIPTIVYNGTEIPAESLQLALQANGVVLPAAGEAQGTDTSDSSGNNFGPPGPFAVEAFDPNPLLPPTQFDRAFGGFIEAGGFETNQPPVIGEPLTVRVSEEGLPGGFPDDIGLDDLTNATIVEGQLNVTDPDGDPLSFVFNEPLTIGGSPITSGGVPLDWTGVGTNTIIGTIPDPDNPSGEPIEIIRAIIEDGGLVRVILGGPTDHPDGTVEDQILVSAEIGIFENGVLIDGTTTINVVIEDDFADLLDLNLAGAQLTTDETSGEQTTSTKEDVDPGLAPDILKTLAGGVGGIVSYTTEELPPVLDTGGAIFGADGAGTVTYSLVDPTGTVFSTLAGEGVATNYFLTGADNGAVEANRIYLFQDASDPNLLIGVVGNDPAGTVALAIYTEQVDEITADVHFVTLDAVEHFVDGTGAAHDDSRDLTAADGSNLIFINALIVDNDTDFGNLLSSQPLSISVFDDGPSLNEPTQVTIKRIFFHGDVIS